ncbi:kinase-like domain-containing protein [Aspergillus recurvatus]
MTVTGKPHNAACVRSISKQIILGVDFFPLQGIVHCDLQPANILVSRVSSAQVEMPLEPPGFSPVRWLDGIPADNSAPRCLLPTQRRRGQLDGADASELFVKIGDLGSVVLGQEPDRIARPVTLIALRAPGPINRKPWNKGIDVWALGCLIFELATNEPLFPLETFGLSAKEVDEEHLRLISQLLDGEGLVAHLTDKLPADFGAENARNLACFLAMMLQQDPGRRMAAAELLKQPFVIGDIEGQTSN